MTHTKMATDPCRAGVSSYKNGSKPGPRRHGRLRAAALGLVGLLLGAMLLAQTLGLMHGVLHAPLMGGAPAAHTHHHEGAKRTDHGGDWLETLFAGHDEGSNSCRVFDQQGHTDLMLFFASLALPSVLRAQLPAEGIACRLRLAAAPFQARAPPSSR